MASSTLPCGTGTNNADVGDVAWSNPGNITSSNNSRATASLAAGQTTQYLYATNFGFAIPAGSTIDGIVVSVERSRGASGAVEDATIIILKGGSRGIENKADAVTAWPTSESSASYGAGTTDLWSETWAYTDINDSGFGVSVRAVNIDVKFVGIAQVDYVEITVYYTAAATGGMIQQSQSRRVRALRRI